VQFERQNGTHKTGKIYQFYGAHALSDLVPNGFGLALVDRLVAVGAMDFLDVTHGSAFLVQLQLQLFHLSLQQVMVVLLARDQGAGPFWVYLREIHWLHLSAKVVLLALKLDEFCQIPILDDLGFRVGQASPCLQGSAWGQGLHVL